MTTRLLAALIGAALYVVRLLPTERRPEECERLGT